MIKGAIVALLFSAAPLLARAETRFALIVGHDFGDGHETPLRWAESDAIRMRAVLSEIGEVSPDRTELLLSPKIEDFERARLLIEGRLREAKYRGERTLFIVYFSGHADQEELHFGAETLSLAKLEKDLRAGAATTVFTIVDACRNDRNPRVTTKGATRAPAFSWPSESASAPIGYVRLMSASEGEVAQESDDVQGSLFTHHLLSGMRGSADFDHDGTVTLHELYVYGYARTLEDTHRRTTAVQHSELEVALSGRGALIVTYPRRAEATIEFGDDLLGHLLLIDDASGRIVAEVHRDAAQSTKLAVSPGKYRVQLRGEDEIRTGLVSAGKGNRVVTRGELSVQSVLAVLEKGPAYDPHPFVIHAGTAGGSSLVRGFGLTPGISLGVDYRLNSSIRFGVHGLAAYGRAENGLWRYQQLEFALSLGAEWTEPLREDTLVIVGARAGLAGVMQDGERKDMARVAAVGGVDLSSFERAFGPRISGVVGIEYQPFLRVGVRLEVEPWAAWIETDRTLETRLGMFGALSLVVRL